MTNLAPLQTLIAQGESETFELKRSTVEPKRAGETLCVFLNGESGEMRIGAGPDGWLVGQEVAWRDRTRIAKHFLQSEALTKFDSGLGSSIRELRNDIAHNEPTPDLMNDAHTHMRTVELRSNTDTFLSQSLVHAVLKELGETEPEELLVNLLAEVRRRLVALARSSGGPT